MKFFLKSIWMTIIAMFLIIFTLAQIEDMIRRTVPHQTVEDPSSYLANGHHV